MPEVRTRARSEPERCGRLSGMRGWGEPGRRRSVLALAVLGLVVAAAACAPPPPPGPDPTPDEYVALGDSFTAGPFIPLPDGPLGCLRSDHDYPHLVAAQLGLPRFQDVSCSGARTSHMTETQDVTPGPPNPPQFDALDTGTAVVTLGIGGTTSASSASPSTAGRRCPSARRARTATSRAASTRSAAASPRPPPRWRRCSRAFTTARRTPGSSS